MLVGGESLNQSDWCMDSGASEHMCNDRDLFEQYSEITDERKVRIGDGSYLKILGIGKIKLEA